MLSTADKPKRGASPYPRNFWFLVFGMFSNRISNSMIWPFLTIYMYSTLGLPLTVVTLLLTLRSLAAIVSTALVGPLMDRFGRRWGMMLGLVGTAAVFVGMAQAQGLLAWAVLTIGHGLMLPIWNTGANAMVVDLLEPDFRPRGFAYLRTAANAGFAIGPVIGGLLAGVDFRLSFYLTAALFVALAVFFYYWIPETKPTSDKLKADERPQERFGGYGRILRDGAFVLFCLAYILPQMGYTQIYSLLPVYSKTQFGLPESHYSLLITLNASMVVFFQYAMTRWTTRYRPLAMLTLGALLTAIGLVTVAWGSSLGHWMLSMFIMTLGELINNPTALSLTAELAPPDMRARYMGMLDLCYNFANGFGPLVGGLLADSLAPVAIWYGAAALAASGMLMFAWLARRGRP